MSESSDRGRAEASVPPYTSAVQPGGGATRFVGRADVLAALQRVVAASHDGPGGVVLVEGEAGIGKTRLVHEVAAAAAATGVAVFAGAADEVSRGRPFGPLIDALGRSATDPVATAVAALLAGEPGAAPSATGPSSSARFRVAEILGDRIERSAAARPTLVTLDDLHWSEPSTLAAVQSIVRRTRELPVTLVATFRSGHGQPELHALTDSLLRAGATLVSLPPLDADAVAALAADVLGEDPSPALVARLEGASGNPLFVIEYLRASSSAPAGEPVGAITPRSFRASITRRLADLPDDTRQLLRLAAVLGPAFTVADLAAVSGRPGVDLDGLLQPAVERAVVEDSSGTLRFRHSLVRDAVYESIPESLRRQLHSEAGRALAAAGGDPLVVARHLATRAGAAPDGEAATWLRAAARANASRSPAVAVELLEQARRLLPPAARERDGLMAELVIALAWAGRLADAESLALDVLAARPDPTVVGPLRCGLVYALTWQGRPHEALRHAEVAEGETVTPADEVLLRAEAAVAKMFAFDMRGAAQLAAEVAPDAERLGNEQALCHALGVLAWAATFAGRPADAVATARRAIDIANSSDSGRSYLAHPRFFPGLPLMYGDRLDEADAVLRAGRRLATELGLAWSLPLYHAHLGIRHYIAGELDQATAELEAGLAVSDEVGLHLPLSAATAAWLTAIRIHRDDLEGADQAVAAAFRRVADTGPQIGMNLLGWARALLHEARGEIAEAIALLQAAWDMYTAGGPVTDPWSAMAFVRLCVEGGEVGRAKAVLPIIAEQAAIAGTPFMRGQALRCHGLVDGDSRVLVAAVGEYRSCPRPLELAAACEDAGRHLAVDDRDAGVALLDEAAEGFDRVGATRDAARVRARLRALGATRGVRGSRGRPTSGWDSLTAAERKVVELVRQRLSNPEVAERLFVSRHTVESHLKAVYRKLGVSSRKELTALPLPPGMIEP